MYIQPHGTNGVRGKWAQYPKTVTDSTNIYAYQRVTARYDYLAKTSGNRSYPWRVVVVSAHDKDLLNNELIFKLAKPQQFTNTAWIKPGKSAWEWWHDGILEGVSMPSGPGHLNFDFYKYYIDFAAKYHIEYVTLDAGYDNKSVKQNLHLRFQHLMLNISCSLVFIMLANGRRLGEGEASSNVCTDANAYKSDRTSCGRTAPLLANRLLAAGVPFIL